MSELVRYDAMCRAIAEAHAVDEVKDIRDKARAIEMYARQAQNKQAEERAREIRLRAERKCGQMLTDMKAAGQMAKGGSPYHKPTGYVVEPVEKDEMLADWKITKRQSHEWQKLAAVPDDLFEQALSEPNPSTSAIITRHEVEDRPRGLVMNNHKALWLWGTLKDFESEGLLDEDPNELIASMLDHMQTTTLKLAPRIAAWLRRIGNE
jgi:hypothetical protein